MLIAPRGTLRIDHPAQLRALVADVPAARRDFGSARLALAGMSPTETSVWEARLSRNLGATGSEAAAIGYGLAILVYGVYLWLTGATLTTSSDAFTVGAAVAVGAAAVGKLVGLARAQRLLAREAEDLANRYESIRASLAGTLVPAEPDTGVPTDEVAKVA